MITRRRLLQTAGLTFATTVLPGASQAAGPTKPKSAGALVTNVPAVRAILEPYDVQLVLSGHGHLRERIELTGTAYIQSGAVYGRWWKG
ncbi:MAG: hypothetical protein K8U03_18295 [Planctomycetia bacterium]|nr:hypothetical protein [Planctomycetia bacterium]